MQTATGLILLGLFMFQGKIVKAKPNVSLNCSEPQDPVYSGQNVSVNCSTITDNKNCMFYRVSGFRDRSKRLNCTGKSDNMTVHSGMYRFGIYVEIHNVTNPGNYSLDFFFDCGVESKGKPFNVTVQEKPDTQQFGTDSTPLQTHLYVGLFVVVQRPSSTSCKLNTHITPKEAKGVIVARGFDEPEEKRKRRKP
uniref:Immunoglobulin subtype domain-containing protein n=1 Tax=Knipowitschia caucasica TaxID=637954 RepID=A0AAV2MPF2_KNICA